ncbi:hypothetical protein ACFFWD_01910 [Bradyrhizobium erythrophlei]|uniref:hypothetical protein n=1 Tax=Bradyrhizobium erythrophlei TaxID=1437360 RepID=UPI0035E807BA
MASATKAGSIAGRLIDRISDWLGRSRDVSDIRSLSAAEIGSIARDLRISRAELETLAAYGRQGREELTRLLKALGIDEAMIAHQEPGVLRDLAVVCALCVAKSRCNREIEAGTAALRYREYCANSYTLDALKTKPKPGAVDTLHGPNRR